MDHKSHQVSFSQALTIAVIYGVTSVLLYVFNRVLYMRFYFDYNVMLLLVQAVIQLVVLEGLRITKSANIAPYTFERGKDMLFPSVCYCMHAVFSLNALIGMNIPMYGKIRSLAPLFCFYLAISLLKKGSPNRRLLVSVVMVSLGALLTDSSDTMFDGWAYFYGFLSVICHGLFLTLIEQLSQTAKYTTMDLLYLHSFNSVFLLLFLDIFDDEVRDGIVYFSTSASMLFWLFFALAIVFGIALNFVIFLCTTYNSALTTTIVGACKGTLQIFFGYTFGIIYFGDIELGIFNFFGIIINLIGTFLFAVWKYAEKASNSKISW